VAEMQRIAYENQEHQPEYFESHWSPVPPDARAVFEPNTPSITIDATTLNMLLVLLLLVFICMVFLAVGLSHVGRLERSMDHMIRLQYTTCMRESAMWRRNGQQNNYHF